MSDKAKGQADRFWIGFCVAAIGITIGNLLLPFWWPAAGLLGRCVK